LIQLNKMIDKKEILRNAFIVLVLVSVLIRRTIVAKNNCNLLCG
jgi:hypothetical protein